MYILGVVANIVFVARFFYYLRLSHLMSSKTVTIGWLLWSIATLKFKA